MLKTHSVGTHLVTDSDFKRCSDAMLQKMSCICCGAKLVGRQVDGDTVITATTEECPGMALINKGVLTSEIDVDSGILVFVNFFNQDENYYLPNGLSYTDRYSLCHPFGRQNTMAYYAERNIGYGQMGNMSISVSSRGDEILVGDTEKQFDGFTAHGDLSLSVWRWMCMDKELLEERDESLDKLDAIEVIVEPGRYLIEHYYCTTSCKNGIFSRIKKIK